ncbi:GH17172 [Drosophila grimshawi]|uniref:GH17172 n=1 Tax=Drosophila grimshawi TaxID=7222 RepID=B4J188_DROGR|nr:GH17172 [Drosophila grimshawi]
MHGYPAGLFILSSCLGCWRLTTLLGGWRPAPIYVAMGVALILYPHNLWLSYVAGMFLLLLALFRLCTLLRFGGGGAGHFKDEGLLPQCDFEKVSSFVDSVEDDFAEVGASQQDDEEPTIDDDAC